MTDESGEEEDDGMVSMALTKMEVAYRRLNRWDSEDVVHHATMLQPMNSNRSMR